MAQRHLIAAKTAPRRYGLLYAAAATCALLAGLASYARAASPQLDGSMPTVTVPVSPTRSQAVSMDNLLNKPVVKWLRSQGATLTPLGVAGGLEGWLVQKDNHMQVVYVTPDGNNLVSGIMASTGGEDVTALQLEAMRIGKPPAIAPGALQAVPSSQNTAPSPSDGVTPQQADAPPGLPNIDPPVMSDHPTASAPSVVGPSPQAALPSTDQGGDNAVMAATRLPNLSKADFTASLGKTANFTVGYPGLPDVVMIADPTCPVCHASWSLLAPLVAEKKIDVTVVLIDLLPNSQTDAIDLLGSKALGEEWLKGAGSVNGVKVPAIPAAQMADGSKYLKMNEKFAYQASVNSTPTVFWVTPKGDVFRGVGLTGVAGFLAAAEQQQAAPTNDGA